MLLWLYWADLWHRPIKSRKTKKKGGERYWDSLHQPISRFAGRTCYQKALSGDAGQTGPNRVKTKMAEGHLACHRPVRRTLKYVFRNFHVKTLDFCRFSAFIAFSVILAKKGLFPRFRPRFRYRGKWQCLRDETFVVKCVSHKRKLFILVNINIKLNCIFSK